MSCPNMTKGTFPESMILRSEYRAAHPSSTHGIMPILKRLFFLEGELLQNLNVIQRQSPGQRLVVR